MLINRKTIFGLIITISIYCATILAKPQSIFEYKFSDTTKFPGIPGGNEIAINGKCAISEIGRFKPMDIVTADLLYNLCTPNTTACNVILYVGTDTQNCTGPVIGSVVIDVYKGVQSIQNDPSSDYQLSYQVVSPQAQEVLISAN